MTVSGLLNWLNSNKNDNVVAAKSIPFATQRRTRSFLRPMVERSLVAAR